MDVEIEGCRRVSIRRNRENSNGHRTNAARRGTTRHTDCRCPAADSYDTNAHVSSNSIEQATYVALVLVLLRCLFEG